MKRIIGILLTILFISVTAPKLCAEIRVYNGNDWVISPTKILGITPTKVFAGGESFSGDDPLGESRSMYFDNDGGSATYVEETVTAKTEIYAEFWIRFSDTTALGTSKSFIITRFYDTSETEEVARIFVITDSGTGDLDRICFVGTHEEGTISDFVDIAPVAETWYQVKCHWSQATDANSVDGVFQGTFAGGDTGGTDALNNNFLEIDTLQLGPTSNPGTDATDVWFDVWKCGSSDGGSQYHTDTWDTSTDAGDNWDGGETNGEDLSVTDSVYYSP